MNTNVNPQYREILFQQFEKKKIRNVRYSLRAFARDLEVPVSRLSDVFSGKKSPSLPMAFHLANKLGLSNIQRDVFVTSVQVAKEKSLSRKSLAEKKLESLCNRAKAQWAPEEFEKVSQWLDVAITVSLSIEPKPTTFEELADLFSVSVEDVQSSIGRLIENNEIVKTTTGWQALQPTGGTSEDVPSEAIKRFHCEMFEKAKVSVIKDPIEVRDFSSIVFSFNSRDLPLLKKRLDEIREQLMMEFGQSKDCDSVYTLATNLFPISNKQKPI